MLKLFFIPLLPFFFFFPIPACFFFSWLSYELPCGHSWTCSPGSLVRPRLPKSWVPPKPSAPAQDKVPFPSVTPHHLPPSTQQLTQPPKFRAPVVCLPHLYCHCTQTSSHGASLYAFKNRASLNILLVKIFPVSSEQSWGE